jgi:hypothetical protein
MKTNQLQWTAGEGGWWHFRRLCSVSAWRTEMDTLGQLYWNFSGTFRCGGQNNIVIKISLWVLVYMDNVGIHHNFGYSEICYLIISERMLQLWIFMQESDNQDVIIRVKWEWNLLLLFLYLSIKFRKNCANEMVNVSITMIRKRTYLRK